jgi:3-methyladenine DNA glycosylase Tag
MKVEAKSRLIEAAVSARDIESVFHDTTIFADRKKVKGATFDEVKRKLNVPKAQGAFIALVEKLGFTTEWSHTENAYVVYKK